MKSIVRGAAAALVLLLAVGCSDDSSSSTKESGPEQKVAVELGEEFTWNDFTVAEGWKLGTTEAFIEMEMQAQPTIDGEITNTSDESRFAIFAMIFARGGDLQASMTCRSDDELAPGDSGSFTCPGLGQVVPKGYDLIQVQEFQR